MSLKTSIILCTYNESNYIRETILEVEKNIPNLELINEEQLWQIDKINNLYARKVKNAKSIAKKYVKGKQSYNV